MEEFHTLAQSAPCPTATLGCLLDADPWAPPRSAASESEGVWGGGVRILHKLLR